MRGLSNVTVTEFRTVLTTLGLTKVATRGGHESWKKPGLTRRVVFQTHINPIPEHVIRSNLRTLGITRQDLLALLNSL